MTRMTTPDALATLLGSARNQTYVDAADGDLERAGELYAWGTSLAGAWHAHIGYIEVATRNAIDRELRPWNAAYSGTYGEDWTADGGAAQTLYGVLWKPLRDAREASVKDAQRRPLGHARKDATPNHDDIVAQLMFGAWTRLVMPPSGPNNGNARQKQLWREALHRSFPGAEPTERGRRYVGEQLEAIRKLRNRIAHHENLLSLPIVSRLNGSLTLLGMINRDFPDLVMGRNPLRQLAAEDPRLHWGSARGR
jgi:hypothetical protein